MKNYRKVYERHHLCCLLPNIDIHHIDGNHNNNTPSNLQAVTLQEHYNIHKSQNDHYACYMIGLRMEVPPDDWKDMARKNGKKSALKNMQNNVGLLAWIKDNPEKAKEACKNGGVISGTRAAQNKTGIHSADEKQKKEWASKGGKAAPGFSLGHASEAGKKGGLKGGAYAKKHRTGIFALSEEKNKQRHFNSVVTRLINNGKACRWPREL